MARVTRISSMVEGLQCVILIDGKPKYFPVHEKNNKKFVTLCGKRMHEHELPMGEEVIV